MKNPNHKFEFIDSIHEGTEDGFKIHIGYKGEKFAYIYVEMDSGITQQILLSEGDIRQIYAQLEDK